MKVEHARVPSGMTVVAKPEFFSRLHADSRDIMPSIADSATTVAWETTRERRLWGWSAPGWKNPGEPKIYALFLANNAPTEKT